MTAEIEFRGPGGVRKLFVDDDMILRFDKIVLFILKEGAYDGGFGVHRPRSVRVEPGVEGDWREGDKSVVVLDFLEASQIFWFLS